MSENESPTNVQVDQSQLIEFLAGQAAGEYAAQSDAGERGDRFKKFLEETGLNSDAVSFVKKIFKKLPKKDGQQKAMDVCRSAEILVPMMMAHCLEVGGNDEMDLGEPQTEEPQDETPPGFDEQAVAAE